MTLNEIRLVIQLTREEDGKVNPYITQAEAFKVYGRKLIEYLIEKRSLKAHKINSRIYYLKSEILFLITQEDENRPNRIRKPLKRGID